MASPPYNHSYNNAMSPTYPSNAQLPQPPKRRQTDMPSSAPAIKRRKASMLSTTSAGSAHPLRQTSFPPESASQTPAYSRSPSADTMVSGSVAGAGKSKKKRGRKLKGANHDNASTADVRSATSDPAGKNSKRRASNASLEEEEDGGDETTAIQMTSETTEQKAREKEHQALLIRGFDVDQAERYAVYRSSRLSDAIVRRIVNQTLSQSAGAPIILAVKTIAKLFAGELIEDSRQIQSQWIKATGEDQTGGLLSPPAENGVDPQNETRRGPLLPDHLREAIRRYKLRREGGLAGQLGLWQIQQQGGVERFGTRVKGKRLLK